VSKDFLYPDISPQALKIIEMMRRIYAENPDYFEKSPYSHEVEAYFRSWFQKPVGGLDPADPANPTGASSEELSAQEQALLGEGKWDALYRESVSLYVQLKNAKPSAGDASESMAYFRTVTGLMDKLVGHQERCLGIKQVHQFHQVVMEIMDAVLSEDQRNTVMGKLKNAINND
jgi:hypothetical protein